MDKGHVKGGQLQGTTSQSARGRGNHGHETRHIVEEQGKEIEGAMLKGQGKTDKGEGIKETGTEDKGKNKRKLWIMKKGSGGKGMGHDMKLATRDRQVVRDMGTR